MRLTVYISYAQCVTEKFVKTLLGKGNDKIQATLEKLDRLTKDEGLLSVAQTLDVVHQASSEINEMKRLLILSSLSLPKPTVFCR